jgi:hypothetical protein
MLRPLPPPAFPRRTVQRHGGLASGVGLAKGAIPLLCCAALVAWSGAAAQDVNTVSPAPIYWRQNLLTVPYQWSGGANVGTPKSVWLYASKDRGATWNQITDAQPQLLAFNYRAEADGEYWFAIRTFDTSGRDMRLAAVPGSAAAMEPELRVIVDTTMPRIDGLTGTLHDDGTLEVRWRAADANLRADSCHVEVGQDATSEWQPVPLVSAMEASPGVWDGIASVRLAPGQQPTSVRATVVDLAGNRALYQTVVSAGSATDVKSRGQASALQDSIPSTTLPFDSALGWVSSSAPSSANPALEGPALPQVWPTDRSASALEIAAASDDEHSGPAITYGAPLGVGSVSPPSPAPVDAASDIPAPQTDDQPLGNVPAPRHQPFTKRAPFRQVSATHTATDGTGLPIAPSPAPAATASSLPAIKHVDSRTFSLAYELAEVGGNGVFKVELWGTRDNGKTWRSYAVDDDNRSPLLVTVDGEGEYGFRIVVEGAGGLGGFSPQPGDRPELLIRVDLEPPQTQITAVDVDSRSDRRQLVVHWDAEDDNLQPRPISLFYSSRPAGPWTAIATSLENVGEYRWPLERYVPRRIYLKLEAGDVAGNVSAYQSTEPITIESEPSVARVQRLPPVDDSIRPLP